MKYSKLISTVGLMTLAGTLPAKVEAKGEQPNILFAIADDMSHASAYGYKFVKTPNFDKVAKNGVIFTNSFTPSSKCAPSRSVIITGRNPWQLEEAANHWPYFPKKFKSVVESLGENGYTTGYTGKGWGPGNTGGRQLTGKAYNSIKVKQPPTNRMSNIDYTANFEIFMEKRDKSKPFFFWYGCKEPHRSYSFKSGAKSGKRIEDLDFLPEFWGTSDDVKHDILDYAYEVEYFDKHLGQILKIIEDAGELDNTLVIVTSDNSMPFPRFKGHPHEFATKIPFTAMWPGKIVKPGRKFEKFTSHIDLAPTFLEVAGVSREKAGMQSFQGKSLVDVFSNNVIGRDYVLTGRERNDVGRPHDQGYPVRSLHKGRYVYMHNFEPDRWPCGNPETGYLDTDGSPTKTYTLSQGPGSKEYDLCYGKRPMQELYDVSKDPDCMNNLANSPEYKELMRSLKTELFKELKVQGDPRMFGKGDIFDKYKYVNKSNFYEKFMEKKSQGSGQRKKKNRARKNKKNLKGTKK